MLLFVDTEFTDFYDPHLVSIGLAAATGETFYAEVPYRRDQCSDFVKEVVIHLLGANPVTDLCDADELRARLRTWLSIVKVTMKSRSALTRTMTGNCSFKFSTIIHQHFADRATSAFMK